MATRPLAEIDITKQLIAELLENQFPELAHLPLQHLSRGWDNTNYRLGSELLVRVPHRQVAAQLIINEQQCLARLAPHIDLGVPTPIHGGVPSSVFPWPWSITPFFTGTEAATADLIDPGATATKLGHFFHQLHTAAPDDTPTNPYRGCPLADRRRSFETNLATLDQSFDQTAIAAIFDHACALAPATDRVWLHGDLHTRNLIVDNGQLSAAIDWGDVCSGDRATDLASAFMLVPGHIDIVQKQAGASDNDWARARGWAINFAVIYLANSDDEAVMHGIGIALLETMLTA